MPKHPEHFRRIVGRRQIVCLAVMLLGLGFEAEAASRRAGGEARAWFALVILGAWEAHGWQKVPNETREP